MTDRLPNLPRKPFVPASVRHGQIPRVSMPVDVTDEGQFPNIAAACRSLADMRVNDPERWARLQADWEGR